MLVLGLAVATAHAGEAPAEPPAGAAAAPAAAAPRAAPARSRREPRKLAPGVLTTIPPEPLAEETFSGPRPIVEIVNSSKFPAWQPNTIPKSATIKEIASRVTFRRTVWHLEFSFKPVRMIYVDIPQPTGRMQRTLVWYIVYRIRNTGAHMNPGASEDEFGHKLYTPLAQNYPVRFFPRFVFEAHKEKKAYLDRIIPAAVRPIQMREDPNTRLFNSVQIAQIDIPVSTDQSSKAVWGVATWTDIDQHNDFFSIYVEGLTNAYKWEDPEGAWTDGDPPGTGRTFTTKTLQLNFWRPGDEVDPHEDEIRLGIPRNLSVPAREPYQWIYR
jgi:hypothetical protein